MSRTLLNVLKEAKEEQPANKNDNKLEELTKAVDFVCSNKNAFNELDKAIKTNKDKIKALCQELNLSEFSTDAGRITISEVDKSYLDEYQTLEYLKKNNLTDYIKTKEYFDEAELMMAISNGKLNAPDLNEFIIDKKEIRVNIK